MLVLKLIRKVEGDIVLDSGCRYLVSVDGNLLGTEQGVCVFDAKQLVHLKIEAHYPLSLFQEANYRIVIASDDLFPKGFNSSELCDLRAMFGCVDNEEMYMMLSSASQIITWHYSFKYCPRCSDVLTAHSTELAKECGKCSHQQYPRISPCIIVLVRKGDHCLLAHSSKFASGRYSTLAGFIEAGESAEHAVLREVKEEVGITVKNIEYCFSQSWPFPHSFMLGFMAEYDEGELIPDGVEILDAGWFKADELPTIPPKFTIARRLIDRFLLTQGVELGDSSLFFSAK